jgi:hypothetical protein
MRGGHDLDHALLAHGGDRLQVACDHRFERLLGAPFWVLIRLPLHLVERESKLRVDRLLDPQRAVIVEGGDAILWLDIVGATLFRHPRHEIDDRLFGLTVIPGWQRISLRPRGLRPDADDPDD